MTLETLTNLALVFLQAVKPHLPPGMAVAKPVARYETTSTGGAVLTITVQVREP